MPSRRLRKWLRPPFTAIARARWEAAGVWGAIYGAGALGYGGILVVNLWGGDRDFATCVERIRGAFDGLVACLPAGKPGNVVAPALKTSPGTPRWQALPGRG